MEQRRRAQRYKLQLPLHIVQVGAERVDRSERTRDISSGGICFLSARGAEVGGRVEYLITLSDTNPPVRIRCLGKVLRSRRPGVTPISDKFEVAVTMERYSFVRPDEVAPEQVALSA